VAKSMISQRPGLTGTGSRTMGDQNKHVPFGASRKGSGLNPDRNPLGSPGQKRVGRTGPRSSGNKVN